MSAVHVVELQAKSDSRALNRVFGARFIAADLRSVTARAASLPPDLRYERLSDWVLPGDQHADFRVSGEFSQTDPSPIAEKLATDLTLGSQGGGTLVSPVFDLLDAASEVGKLEELRRSITSVRGSRDEDQQRARAALLLLVNLELKDSESTDSAADLLFELLETAAPQSLADMWPETLVAWRGGMRFQNSPAVAHLLDHLYSRRRDRPELKHLPDWHNHIAALFGRQKLTGSGLNAGSSDGFLSLQQWIPLKRSSAWTRGKGLPQPLWQWNGKEVLHVSGHENDYLLFRSPLRGNFAIEGEIEAGTTTQFYAAGKYFGPHWNTEGLEVGTYRGGSNVEKVDPPFSRFDATVSFRAAFRDGRRTVSINGRPIHMEDLDDDHDPWVGFRSWGRNYARVVNVRISGRPQIPEAVPISVSPELPGWLSYHLGSVGSEEAAWYHVNDAEGEGQIHGRRWFATEGTFQESLLTYYRPLIEDGSIEYEFLWEPGRLEVHPALDRLAFLLDPRGVRVHWITDGKFDRTGIPPDNTIDEPQNRRGPAGLPLEAGKWNRVKLSLSARTVELVLNGQLVYERELEATNQRTFGLFHYADQTDVRVRDVVLKGDWPKAVPPVLQQRLADPIVASLDEDLTSLKSVFTHDFVSDGQSEAYFLQTDSDQRGSIVSGPEGLRVSRPAAGQWAESAVIPRFVAYGDFDLTAEFDDLQVDSDYYGCIMLVAYVDDDRQSHCRLIRTRPSDRQHKLDASVSVQHPDGTRTYPVHARVACDARGGRLRLARRGSEVHYLFAEKDSDAFRLIGTETVSDRPTQPQGIGLRTLCDGIGEAEVAWKSVTLRAEQLKYLPPQTQDEQRMLYIMDTDGSEVRILTPPAPGFTHLGSPEFSPDGSRIALDMSRGSTAGSHIYILNVDGSGLRDVGRGCMPSFSGDAKQLVQSQPGSGVVVMDSDGSNRRTIDRSGWGAQWSPDGKYIAYGKSGNILLLDVATKAERELLQGANAGRYSYIYWNMGWSHDGRSIAFKARNRQSGDFELAVVGVEPPHRFKVLYSAAGSINADFTWSPDDREVLFAKHNPVHKGPQLYLVGIDGRAPPTLLPGQPADKKIFDCEWSPDGQYIVFSGTHIPQPRDWPAGSE